MRIVDLSNVINSIKQYFQAAVYGNKVPFHGLMRKGDHSELKLL